MTEKKTFINEENKATFVCPKCERTTIADVSAYKNIEKAVKLNAKCTCGHRYSVLLERRKYYRKATNLPGNLRAGKSKFPMIVKDLSRTGLKLELRNPVKFEKDQILDVEFHLDDAQNSLIQQPIRVRSSTGQTVGAEFSALDPGDSNYKAIGFYLLT